MLSASTRDGNVDGDTASYLFEFRHVVARLNMVRLRKRCLRKALNVYCWRIGFYVIIYFIN